MGRLNRTTCPIGDPVSWSPLTFAFQQIQTTEHDPPAGLAPPAHARQPNKADPAANTATAITDLDQNGLQIG
jgi:hypothetical protein